MASCREITDCGTTRRSVAAEAAAGSAGVSSSGGASMPGVPQLRVSDLAASETTASSARRASSEVSRAAVFARIRASPSRRLSCSVRWASVLVLVGPDPGPLLAHQQGGDLELRAHRGHHPAALGRRLDLAHGAGEHRDDAVVVAVADPPLLSGRGAANARLALPSSSHRLLLRNLPGTPAAAGDHPCAALRPGP